ncbi:MAG: Hint domain-containing protein [Shimia sp.]
MAQNFEKAGMASLPRVVLRDRMAGLTAGTLVMTADGLTPVEMIEPGDRVVTREGGMEHVTAIDHDHVTTTAVEIGASALGHARPSAPLTLPSGQRIVFRGPRAAMLYNADEVAIPVYRMADGAIIRSVGVRNLRLVRLSFGETRIIYAGELEMLCHPFG